MTLPLPYVVGVVMNGPNWISPDSWIWVEVVFCLAYLFYLRKRAHAEPSCNGGVP